MVTVGGVGLDVVVVVGAGGGVGLDVVVVVVVVVTMTAAAAGPPFGALATVPVGAGVVAAGGFAGVVVVGVVVALATPPADTVAAAANPTVIATPRRRTRSAIEPKCGRAEPAAETGRGSPETGVGRASAPRWPAMSSKTPSVDWRTGNGTSKVARHSRGPGAEARRMSGRRGTTTSERPR
ncbi:MAG TPA: hypothetical protein VFN65_12000 [Solirubrobacteraceae bacterium]|nr:hypothetical protein [Solirubrobacteraceae bacterium]